nr:BTB/POZ domain-containing protein 17 isoform X1 [Onthophagus taurus]
MNKNKNFRVDCDDESSPSKSRRCANLEMENSCQMAVDNSENVLKTMRNLFHEKLMTDINLVVGDKEHPAHRLILCACSDVFQAMLSKPEWSECYKTRVILQELPQCEVIFGNFLEYFYTGKIIITYNNVMAILALADKYIVKSLSRLCLEYMSTHIPQAAAHNVLFSWVQYTMSCGHKEVSSKCYNYIKWNLSAVANSPDFSDLDVDLVINLLQQNDLIVYNEMVLYNFMVRWLDLQRIQLIQNGLNFRDVDKQMDILVEMIMSNIRFPMMNPKEIAELLLSPLVKKYKEFFVNQMTIAMVFHSGQNDTIIKTILETDKGKLLFNPRLYISDLFSSILCIDHFRNLPNYHTSTFLFSSHISATDSDSDRINEWVVDLYPKGVWFQKCYLILWQGPIEIPGEIFSTVRLSLTCREIPQDDMKVRIGILLYAKQGGIEFVIKTIEKVHYFNSQSRVLNLDNLIPFEELNPTVINNNSNGKPYETKYLIGPNNDQLKINIVITPVCFE